VSRPVGETRWRAAGVNAALLALAALSLAPLAWMLSVSFMPRGEAAQFPPPLLPSAPTLDNYRELFARTGMARHFGNSLLLAVSITGLSLLVNTMAGYAFAKLRFRGRERLFQLLLAALVVPAQVAMLPLFLLVTYAPPGPDIPMPFTDGTRVPLTLLVVMLMLGGVFSLIPAVMWPAVAYIVRESRLGSAYSMMTLCQQVGVALVPLVVGRFNTAFGAGPEHPAGYAPGMWFYTALAALGLLFSYLLWRAESGPAAHGLEYPSGEKPA